MLHLALFSIFSYFLLNFPAHLSAGETVSYNTLLFSYFLIAGSLSFLKLRNLIDMFEPISMVIFISLFLYVISPMIFLIRHETFIETFYMFKGCTTATILYTISYFSFLLGYYKNKYTRQTAVKIKSGYLLSKFKTTKILLISYIGWSISFALSLIYYVFGSGMSLGYVLLFSLLPNEANYNIETPLKFLINFSWSMIPFWIYIMLYSHNKLVKIVLTMYTTAIFMYGGNRFIFIILFGSLFVINYILKNKRPSLKLVSLVLLSLIISFVILGYARNGIRSGLGFSLSTFNPIDELYTTFYTNSNIVMPFYCIVDKMPRLFPHDWGYGYFIEPFYYFLPRILFPWKPGLETADIVVAMNRCSGFDISKTYGMATPNFSELYIEFGYLGCIIGMFLFGLILSKIKTLYTFKKTNIHYIIIYAILFTALFQLLIRGYMATNVYLIIFLIGPVYIVRYFCPISVKYSRIMFRRNSR